METFITRRRLIIAAWVSGFFFILGIGLYLFLHRASTLTITTEQGGNISITTEQGGKFTQIGAGQATYKSAKLPITVYVLAEKSGRKSLTGVLLERGKNPTAHLALSNTVAAQKVSDGAVLNAYFDGTTVQGTVPSDGTLTSFRTDTFAATRPAFVSMPYINKIIWYDLNNFVYQTVDRSIGQFRDGGDVGIGFLRDNVTGDVATDEGEDIPDGSGILASDIAQAPGKPLVIMSHSNIFISGDKGLNLRAITRFAPNSEENALFASDQSIFRVSNPAAGDEGEDHDTKPPSISVLEYDYSGKQLNTYGLADDSPIVSVTKHKDTIYALTVANLYAIKNNRDTPQKLGIYFGQARDMALYKGGVVILGDDGLWKLSDDGKSLQLLYDYSKNGVGLAGSLSITPDGRLIFGTEPQADKTDQVGAMFSTSF